LGRNAEIQRRNNDHAAEDNTNAHAVASLSSTVMILTNSALVTLAVAAHLAFQSFQSTPVMGWNSYNQMSCRPTTDKITSTINSLASRGFVAVSCNFFQIDGGRASRDGQHNATNGL
jgi:alpha-galactosidase